MSSQESYFVYGRHYIPPAIYVRVDGDGQSYIVDPAGKEMRAQAPRERWLERVVAGWMGESSKAAITAAIEEWNSTNQQQLKLP